MAAMAPMVLPQECRDRTAETVAMVGVAGMVAPEVLVGQAVSAFSSLTSASVSLAERVLAAMVATPERAEPAGTALMVTPARQTVVLVAMAATPVLLA